MSDVFALVDEVLEASTVACIIEIDYSRGICALARLAPFKYLFEVLGFLPILFICWLCTLGLGVVIAVTLDVGVLR